MSHLSFLFFFFVALHGVVFAQKRWDGEAGNDRWNDPWNWTGNTVPLPTENVVLDNSLVAASYTVVLPSTAVTIRFLSIQPLLNRTIELTLPATNTQIPGFVVSGPGYGMTLHAGAVFRNSSGSGSGNAVNIADSIRILNGGRYVHNSSGGHTNAVQVLSASPGTETGIFQLNIPSASSTISLSGRTFGILELTADAAGGNCNYTAAGTSDAIIRSDLLIRPGVNLNLNFSDTIFVYGDLLQDAGTFNLGNSIRSSTVLVHGGFVQETGGVITESGTGISSIVLASDNLQLLGIRGTWTNSVALVKAGSGTVLMKTPVSLPYRLVLRSGMIVSSDLWVLTLQPNCTIEADSLSSTGFVSGPLRKEGLSNSSFLFPVGNAARMRWIRLEQATGTFTVKYVKSNPRDLSGSLGTGLHHVSSIEYWDITSSGSSTARIKLSFADPHSGGVTDLNALRVGRLSNGTWQDAGNTAFAGSPGSHGWVISQPAVGFSATTRSFALASAVDHVNPLPVVDLAFDVVRKGNGLLFSWQVNDHPEEAEVFELQESNDGQLFTTFHAMDAMSHAPAYRYFYIPGHVAAYYRVRMKNRRGVHWYESEERSIIRNYRVFTTSLRHTLVDGTVSINIISGTDCSVTSSVMNAMGQIFASRTSQVRKGETTLNLTVAGLPAGIYLVRVQPANGDAVIMRFVKR